MPTIDAEGTGLVKGPNGDLIPEESSAGWRADAHKNLPGFRLMWNRFPNAEWFVMIDDESYLFLDNLAFELRKHNAEQPFYFGNANMFVGCDGVNRLGDGPNFAHGGSVSHRFLLLCTSVNTLSYIFHILFNL